MIYRHTTPLHGDYLDGDLPPEQRTVVEQHVATCDACRADLERLQNLTLALKKVNVPDPGDEYFDNLIEVVTARTAPVPPFLLSSSSPSRRPFPGSYMLKLLIRLAAAVTLLFFAFYVSDYDQERRDTQWTVQPSENGPVAQENIDVEGRLINPPVGINLVGIPSPLDRSSAGAVEDTQEIK
jgi:anti-sigma factor RsiW